ncbi:MAG: DEAD/DEAH box helicase family protein [Clostridia bacterium]|nr:DEAD/DEAH box helicase family protein [Clostridia bacterium]
MSCELNVSVTTLSQYVCRSGDLSGGSSNSVSALQGTQLHRKIFKELEKIYGEEYETEYSLSGSVDYKSIILNIRGRADVVIENKDGLTHIIEIKSINSTKNSYEKLVRTEHEAQLKIYAALYMLANEDINEVCISLRYVSITTLEAYDKTSLFKRDEAIEFLEEVGSQYADFALKLINYEASSLDSISKMKFPYDSVRPGQAQFMKNALFSMLSKEALFVEAPTGTGKTISVLYPAIKGLTKRTYAQIFYLTAKTQTRVVATKALNDMRKQGLLLRSILLASKESMCPYGEKCDSKYCPLAIGYYSRVKPALDEALQYDEITPDLIGTIAMKHQVCPHELSLDVLNYCNVIIGDYNHAFDPRVKIIRSFEGNTDLVVLVDEAHNMVDRSRTMFSGEFRVSLVKEFYDVLKGKNQRIENYLIQLDQYFRIADHCINSRQSAFKTTENIDEKKCLQAERFEGTRETPKNLYAILWKTTRFLSPYLDELESGPLRKKAMEFFFEARHFLTVLEQFYDESYITCYEKRDGELYIKLTCLDASSKLNDLIKDKLSVVFFSATMTPYEYYRNVLVGKNCDYARHFELASPFPPENLEIIIDSTIKTTYKERSFTLKQVASRILEELDGRTGNYMMFFPSFDYMNKVANQISELAGDSIDIFLQTPGMTSQQKDEYLDRFNEPSEKILLGGAVLGGHFGEGIDLVGEKLSGVVIVGVGIPQISPEREILSNYFSEKFGDGYAFAYRFPGWEKVLQAVGRVIRTETDTGFALLIDERLEKPEYLQLYPDHWQA